MQSLVRDAYYDDPLIEAAERFWQSEEWAETRRLIGPGAGRLALDVGAGRGIASYALARDGWIVTALEPDGSNLVGAGAIRSLAHVAGIAIEVEQQLSETLPFGDKQFDLVYGRAVLHHIGDLGTAAREFARVLKTGGQMLAVREHVISRTADLDAFFNIHPLHWRYGGENAHKRNFYETKIKQAGLDLQSILGPLQSPINYAPYSKSQLIEEISKKAEAIPMGRSALRTLLQLPVVGTGLIHLLQHLDHRPGRLYSFLAVRN
jgi:ubiquinone/menaquinone biosynthesis C-methylase UbiE